MAGHFITFEGGEGSGKSTQVARLAARLQGTGHTVAQTREPGGTEAGEAFRALLVNGDPSRWTPKAEALLNYAAREMHLVHVIRPALARGDVVICDRFMDSTRAYQGHAGGVNRQTIDDLERDIVGETRPVRTLMFDLDPVIGLARAKGRGGVGTEDRYERKGLAFHQKLREGFLDIAGREPQRCRVIDAGQAVEQVEAAVWAAVKDLF
jgi:dTMP kinase